MSRQSAPRREPPPAPELPASIRSEELVGRWGLASYMNPNDRVRTENAARGAGIAGHLRSLRLLRFRDQPVHVDVDRRFEETGITPVVILNCRMARIIVDHLRQLRVARVVNFQLFGDGRWWANVVERHFVWLQFVFQEIVPIKDRILV